MVQFIGKRVQVPQREDGLGSIFSTLAAPLMNTLQNDLRRAQLTGMEAQQAQKARELAAREGLAVMFEGGDLNPAQAAAAGLRGGIDPKTVTGYNLFSAAGRHGVGSQQADNAAFGGGAPFAQTAMGFREGLQNAQTLQQMQEATKLKVANNQLIQTIGPDGRPTYIRQADAVGAQPVLGLNEVKGVAATNLQAQPGGLAAADPTQRAFVGADQKDRTPYVATMTDGSTRTVFSGPNGIVDSQTGQAIPPGQMRTVGRLEAGTAEGFQSADAVERQVFDRRVATNQAVASIEDLMRSLSQPDAGAAVGYLGSAAVMFNNMRAQFEATSKLIGGSDFASDVAANGGAVDNAVRTLFSDANFNSRAQQLGVDAAMVRSQIQNLAYMIAKSNDPSGRMSDRDIAAAMQEIGASLQDPQAMAQVLGRIRERTIRNQQIFETTMAPLIRNRPGAPGAPAPQTPAPGAPAPQAPAPTTAPVRMRFDANGNPVQ